MKKILYTALTSSFNSDGSINKEAMNAFIKYNIEVSNVDGLYVNGSTGEFPMITLKMKKELLETVKELTNENIKLIAQVGSTSIFETIELGKYAESLGYKKLSIISPFYFKLDFDAYYQYYKKVSESLNSEIYPYYIPHLTGVTFTNEEIQKILNIPKVKGIKFSCPNVQQLQEVRHQNPDKEVYWGWDEMMISGLMANVTGFIGSTYSLNGINARRLINAFEEKDIALAQELTHANIKIIDKMVSNNLNETIKYAITKHYDVKNGTNILPTKPLNDRQKKIALNILEDIKKCQEI